RRHISIVKQGREYFHLLHQESLKRKKALKAQQTEATTWITDFQPDKYSSDVEVSGGEINTINTLTEGSQLKKKKMTLRSFTPVYTNVLTPRFAEEKREQVFRQLCAIHWLLEASTLESNNLIHSILSCWNQTDPGGFKKSVKEMEGEKLTACMWELFLTNTKKYLRKARRSPLTRRANKAFAPFISQLSSQSSHGQTPFSSVSSLVVYSEDNAKVTGALSDSMSVSQQPKEQQPFFPSPQKLIQVTDEASKDVREQEEQEDTLKKTELKSLLSVAQKDYRVNMPFIKDQESITLRNLSFLCFSCSGHISNFIKNKSNLRADARQNFTAIRDEAACRLHDTLESLERSQEERCSQKYQALKRLKYFKEDMERLRQLDVRPEREQENELMWFPVLLARLPESVKSDHYVKKILKKLEKFGLNPDLQIPPDTFLKVLSDLQVWELCSPEIAAAVEFVRENIVQMPEEDFSEWFQTRVDLL
ncbi:CCD60 protein, partial [Penelope pileata]|nr:CCD60 protein [Penelope pileata]